MGLFKRLKDITLANINAVLDKVEDPVKMLDQYLRDMEEDIRDASEAVAQQIAISKKFERQYQEAAAMVEKRQNDAIKSINAGRDDLAKKALADKKNHELKMNEFKAQFEIQSATAEKLKDQLAEMKTEYEKLKAKRDTLVARANAARAAEKVYAAMSGLGSSLARHGFERMEEKVMAMEARTEASKEFAPGGSDLDKELAELGKDSAVEDELAALKKH